MSHEHFQHSKLVSRGILPPKKRDLKKSFKDVFQDVFDDHHEEIFEKRVHDSKNIDPAQKN